MSHVFISYSHQNRDYAHKLAEALQQRGFVVWIDDRIDYGSQWAPVIQENLDNSEAFVVIMTPNAYESKWVQNELARAQSQNKPIFPLLLEGGVWLAVQATQYVDVRGKKMPDANFYTHLHRVTSHEHFSPNISPPMAAPLSPPARTIYREPDETESRGIRIFNNDDEGYEQWVKANPNGFVFNAVKPNTPYMLHRANCSQITAYLQKHPTTSDLLKICSVNKEELVAWGTGKSNKVQQCKFCKPWALTQTLTLGAMFYQCANLKLKKT